jgi:hypothetical protein
MRVETATQSMIYTCSICLLNGTMSVKQKLFNLMQTVTAIASFFFLNDTHKQMV